MIVWQKSMDLAKEIYAASRNYPKDETYGLVSQMRRAVVSVPANIAEGQGRQSRGEFLQFLGIAKGSLSELETLLALSQTLGYLTTCDSDRLSKHCDEIGRLLTNLRKALLVRKD